MELPCVNSDLGGVRADEKKAIFAAVKCIKGHKSAQRGKLTFYRDDIKNTQTQNIFFLYLICHWSTACVQLLLE